MSDLLSLRPHFGSIAAAGGWELVTDPKTADPLAEAVRADGYETTLPVRAERFIAMGEILVSRTDRYWATFDIPEPAYFNRQRPLAERLAAVLRAAPPGQPSPPGGAPEG